MKYTKENIIDGIKAKINTINEPEVIKRMFVEKISQYPVEIEQNILEWVNDKPLTKIECHGESLVEIIERWGFDNSVVHLMLFGFTLFKESGFNVPDHIWQSVIGEQCIYD